MSEQAQRYDIGLDCEDAWIQRYTDGDYVLYTDYAKLEAECAALREALKLIIYSERKVCADIAQAALKASEGV